MPQGQAAPVAPAAFPPIVHVDKLDLLFMIDNSPSMADKQGVLADTIPRFVDRLVNPHCVDANQAFVAALGPNETCPAGSSREFPPVTGLHIGVISSSLGGHGADSCSDTPTQKYTPRHEDMACREPSVTNPFPLQW